MKIMIAMRVEVQRLLDERVMDHRVAIISITDTTKDVVKFDVEKHSCMFLPVAFHDLDKPEPGPGMMLITDEISDNIARFVDEAVENNVKVLLIHCTAGVSRSPGVGAAVSQFYFGESGDYFKRYVPNMLVYRKVLEALHRGSRDGRRKGDDKKSGDRVR